MMTPDPEFVHDLLAKGGLKECCCLFPWHLIVAMLRDTIAVGT